MIIKRIILQFFFTSVLLVLLTRTTEAQKWDSIDDSTYASIYKTRFNQGNIIVGVGGMLSYVYQDKMSIYPFSIGFHSGYMVKNRWTLGLGFDYNIDIINQGQNVFSVNYFQYLVGPYSRYYFKPKQKTFFIQISAFYGDERYKNNQVSGVEEYQYSDYGGSISLGLSLFVRNFEFEIIAGAKIISRNFTDDISTSDYLQLNLTYRIPK